ncbi:glycosylhydrolase-like jelly roll fold domain-containing protein [Streptomyces lancefieldiae]|uniref:DNA-binding protein n=1 Tax=Streptomyces lancefieldiae TaxID=3075520 RepID=A0ABU3ALH3_9ACTN|nr:glycosylhydrolase-like jelly roll fold domain-containing protein [Streptomyces sp. DSM 40712]MDT0611049.1 DNA-binding protein [Streptomyces sp. DSM 40712]
MPDSDLTRRRFVVAAGAAGGAAFAVGLPGTGAATAQAADAGAEAARTSGYTPEDFADPRRDSRPTVYWYWNGTVTPALVETQMADLRSKGMYEVVLFPFDNAEMRPVFFSEEWFAVVGHVLRVAERTGMRVWIFNDDHFPSGRAGEYIVNGGTVGSRTYEPRPDLRLKALWRSTTVVEGPASVDLTATTGVGVDTGRLVADADVLGGAAVLSRGARWTDCTVTGSAKAEHGAAGLVVRASRTGTDGYAVEFDQTGVVTVLRLTDGAAPAELARSSRTDGFNRTKYHTLVVTVRGDSIGVTLDGKDKGTVTDARHTTGSVGVRAVDGQRALWENLTVTGADGTTLYEEPFDAAAVAGDFPARPRPEGTASPAAAAARPVGATGTERLVELTADLRAGRPWQVPAGRWQIDVFGGSALIDDSQGYSRGYVDLLDDEPVDLFLDMIPGEYHRRFARYFGNVIPGFWDDEPYFASAEAHFKRLPWSPALQDALRAVGVEPGTAYACAFDDLGRDGRIARGRYWQAVSDRFAAYFQKQSRWYGKRDVALVTNPLYDETSPSKRIASTGDLHKVHQWAQVPGGDIITAEYAAGEPTMIPRNPVSVAHQMGRERALLEAFGNMGWQVAPDFARALVGANAARGINLTVLHALWTDETRVYFPPPFGPRAPWWWAMEPLADWIGRVMEVARGTSAARTALVQPQRAAEQWRGTARQGAVDSALSDAAYALEAAQVDFDLVHDGALSGDGGLLAHATTRGGRLTVGAARYDLAVLPLTPTLDAAVVRTLTAFVRGGGTVVAVGELPRDEANGGDRALERALSALFGDQVPGSRRTGAGTAVRVADASGLREAAHAAGVAAAVLEPAADAVRVLRTTRGKDIAFLVNNESGQAVETVAALPARGVPELWDPATGLARPAPVHRQGRGRDGLRVPLSLRPYETLAVVVRSSTRPRAHLTDAALPVESVTARGKALHVTAVADAPGSYPLKGTDDRHSYRGTVEVTDPLHAIGLGGDWTLTLDRDGAESVTRPLGSWTDLAPEFSGSGTYTITLDLDRDTLRGRGFRLDLGVVREVAAVTVNGTELPPLLWSPYTADVTDVLRAGSNTIAVRVSNTLSNERRKPLPSGLLGPVTLRPYRRVTAVLERV